MKPPTVFLGEMTNPEVEAFLAHHHTVIIPTGATEQHGPHAPLATDVIIPKEVARRVAPQIGNSDPKPRSNPPEAAPADQQPPAKDGVGDAQGSKRID